MEAPHERGVGLEEPRRDSWPVPVNTKPRGPQKLRIFFRARRCSRDPDDEIGADWYYYDPDPDPNGARVFREKLENCPPEGNALQNRPPTAANMSTCVAVGTVIYVLGGARFREGELARDVFYFDAALPSFAFRQHWCEGPPMNVGRHTTQHAVIERKIYVIGGLLKAENCKYWAEVLDTTSRKPAWEALPLPDCAMCPDKLPLAKEYHPGRHVLGFLPGSREVLVAYDVMDKTWKRILDTFICFGDFRVEGHFIYSYAGGQVWGYGLFSLGELCFAGVVRGLEDVLPPAGDSERVKLLRLCPGLLAVFWFRNRVKDTSEELGVAHLVIFSVSIARCGRRIAYVQATVVLNQSIRLPRGRYAVDGSVITCAPATTCVA